MGEHDGTEQHSSPTDLTVELDLGGERIKADLHDPAERQRAERALETIPGVLAARLIAGYERDIDELHVVTDLERAPKRTVRDVQTLLMARFGVTTDHRVVSVVQLDEITPPVGARRIAIDRVGLTGTSVHVAATVELRADDARLVGTANGSGSESGRARATAAATLDAVGQLLGEGTAVELGGVEIVEVAAQRLAVAVVEVSSARGSQTLTGTATVRDATPDTVVRAVLDALNRLLATAS